MKGDFSRVTFNPKKHYNRVLMQQGRVQLDADWNEQQDINEHQIKTQIVDVVGPYGTPKGENGFLLEHVSSGGKDDFVIHPGRIYVNGFLCELETGTPVVIKINPDNHDKVTVDVGNVDGLPFKDGQWVEFLDKDGETIMNEPPEGEQPSPQRLLITDVKNQTLTLSGNVPDETHALRRVVTYKTQPYLQIKKLPDDKSDYLAYLDVWERTVTSLEDPDIREVALNGSDTAIRSQIVWQVKLESTEADDVEDAFNAYLDSEGNKFLPPVQMIAKRSNSSATMWENQLYRVEIHNCNGAFKWARDNASIVAQVQQKPVQPKSEEDNWQITIINEGRNSVSGFMDCPWVELTDETRTLAGQSGFMLKVNSVNGTTLTLDKSQWNKDIDQLENSTVRRWDGYRSTKLCANEDFPLENEGIEIKFEKEGSEAYHTGDYWLIPSRTDAISGIEWPPGNRRAPVPLPQPPLGIRHTYCPLALLTHSGEDWTVKEDGRPHFANLTTGLLSKSGDTLKGQLVIDQQEKPKKLDLVTTGKVYIAADDDDPTDDDEVVLTVNGETKIVKTDSDNSVKLGLVNPDKPDDPNLPHLLLLAPDAIGIEDAKPYIAFSDQSGFPYRAVIEYTGEKKNTLTIQGRKGDDPELSVHIEGKLFLGENEVKVTTAQSDKRLKKNIEPILEALSKVLKLNGVQFEWKVDEYKDKDLSSGRQIGLVAQDVEKTIPEVVSEDTEGFKAIDYGRLVPLLIEAVKELKNENEALKQRIDMLEKRLY